MPPKENAAFVSQMEEVLELYQGSYDEAHPLVCMDERPKRLLAEVREPLPLELGEPRRED